MTASFFPSARRAVLLFAALALAACMSSGTSYTAPIAAGTSQGWALRDVVVTVPGTLEVSESKSIFPKADIVWREDLPGDRRAQVADLLDTAATAGAKRLQGTRPVILRLTGSRFQALTLEAERVLSFSGVHDVEFTAELRDARSGALLAGPEHIEASIPAMSGEQMIRARIAGQSQRSQISAQVTKVIAGWLGLGPDPRGEFRRLGG